MVSIDKLQYVVNTHKGKRKFKEINQAVNFLNLWRQMHESYLSAFMTVEVNKNLHRKKTNEGLRKIIPRTFSKRAEDQQEA